jgi:hypothetical protein
MVSDDIGQAESLLEYCWRDYDLFFYDEGQHHIQSIAEAVHRSLGAAGQNWTSKAFKRVVFRPAASQYLYDQWPEVVESMGKASPSWILIAIVKKDVLIDGRWFPQSAWWYWAREGNLDRLFARTDKLVSDVLGCAITAFQHNKTPGQQFINKTEQTLTARYRGRLKKVPREFHDDDPDRHLEDWLSILRKGESMIHNLDMPSDRNHLQFWEAFEHCLPNPLLSPEDQSSFKTSMVVAPGPPQTGLVTCWLSSLALRMLSVLQRGKLKNLPAILR